MDRQSTLTDGTLILRALHEDDRAPLLVAGDAETWAGHPAKDRWKPEVFTPYFDGLLASKETLVAILDGTVIGCSRYYTPQEDPHGIAIGYTFLNHAHWGGTMNRRMKALMLSHAFTDHDTVWFHIAPSNIRSQKATIKLGAVFVDQGPKNVGGTVGDWKSYTLSKPQWVALS